MRAWAMTTAMSAYVHLLPILWIGMAAVFVLLALGCVPVARRPACLGMLALSYALGLIAWLLGAAVSFATFGWTGLIIGLCFFGVGVIPVAVLGALVQMISGEALAVTLVILLALAIGSRRAWVFLAARSVANAGV